MKVFPPSLRFHISHHEEQDEHHVIHQLEDEFNRLHGLVDTLGSPNLDDCPLPDKPSVRKTSVKKTSLAGQTSSTMSSRAPKLLILCPVLFQNSAKTVGPRVTFCERDGFPIGKPLSIIFSGFTRSPWAD
ncbi:hypothetical protein CDAR_601001 [Caerostris darwini]|uniref:Uncharacterized protein n=1 Tax=Caerostris darwini TaxID=1538125 RepID=A0AAV4NJR3_9ARAC|nr:hypothetical protein CDAR_601001 [Caerostris darwini]